MKLSIQQVVKDESSLVLFKVRLKTLAKKLGFDSICIENMQIVASEMLSNQIKYSQKTGMVQLWFNNEGFNNKNHNNDGIKNSQTLPVTIDIFAMDYGPGIEDVEKAFQDGYTTSKTMGKGLGSISRMAHESGIFTLTEQKSLTDQKSLTSKKSLTGQKSLTNQKSWHGVACWGRFYRSENEKPARYQYGAFCRSYHDLAQNGDDLWLQLDTKKLSCLHLDATGHGSEAELIVKKMRNAGADIHKQGVKTMLDISKRQLKSTAGGAVVALKYNAEAGQGEYSAVGDMRVFTLNCSKENPLGVIHDLEVASGILGIESRSHSRQKYTLESNELIFSTSDGIRRNWKLTDFPGLWDKHPQLICFFLGNKKGRSSDDQSMIAIKKT